MSDGIEAWDLESQFYREQCRKHGVLRTDANEENFCERVAVMTIDGGLSEEDAYDKAFECVHGVKS